MYKDKSKKWDSSQKSLPRKSKSSEEAENLFQAKSSDIKEISVTSSIQSTVRQELNRILNEIQNEMEEFVRFVEVVEQQSPIDFERSPPANKPSSLDPPKFHGGGQHTIQNVRPFDSRSNNAALRDAFRMVRKLLLKVAALMDKIASETNPDNDILNSSSPVLEFYYAEYVFQIAFFLLKMIGEHFNKFSEVLTQIPRKSSFWARAHPMNLQEGFGANMPHVFSANFPPNHIIHDMIFRHMTPNFETGVHIANDNTYKCNIDQRLTSHISSMSENEFRRQLVNSLDSLVFILQNIHSCLDKTRLPKPGFHEIYSPSYPSGVLPKVPHQDICKPMPFFPAADVIRKTPSWLQNDNLNSQYYKTIPEQAKLQSGQRYEDHNVSKKPFPTVNDPSFPSTELVYRWRSSTDNVQRPWKAREDGQMQSQRDSAEKIFPKWRSDTRIFSSHPSVGIPKECLPQVDPKQLCLFKEALKMGALPLKERKKIFAKMEGEIGGEYDDFVVNEHADYEDPFDTDDFNQRSLNKCSSEDDPFGPAWGLYLLPDAAHKDDSQVYQEVGNVTQERRGTLAFPRQVTFDTNLFSNLIKEEFAKFLSKNTRVCTRSSASSESNEILNLLIICFEKASNIPLSKEVNVKVPKSYTEKKYYKKGKVSKDNYIYPQEKPAKSVSDEILDKFITDTLNVAAQMVHSKNLAKLELESDNEGCDVTKKCENNECSSSIEGCSSPIKGCSSSIEGCSSSVEGCSSSLEGCSSSNEGCSYLPGEEDVQECCPSPTCNDRSEFCVSNLDSASSYANFHPDCDKPHYEDEGASCWDGCHQGLKIHQKGKNVPAGLLEVREVDDQGKINTSYQTWDKDNEPEDWRWQKNLLEKTTHVKIEQEASHTTDPIVKVVYGPEDLTLTEEIDLKSIDDATSKTPKVISTIEKRRSKSYTWRELCTEAIVSDPRGSFQRSIDSDDLQVIRKYFEFFNSLQKAEYCKGPPLLIKLRRDSVMDDALRILMAPSGIPLNYYRDLRAIFLNDTARKEEDSSVEVQTREMFEIFAEALFTPRRLSLFEYPSKDAISLYLDPSSPSHLQWFELAGTVLALAILHQRHMCVRLALSFFKALLDRPLTIHDLIEIDPNLYRKLNWLKATNIDRENKTLYFTIRDRLGLSFFNNELIPNGSKTLVTEENKYEYIEMATKWVLAEKCLPQLRQVRNGFTAVLDPCLLCVFSVEDLQHIIKGPQVNYNTGVSVTL